jgi:hypothetical protein
MATVGLGGLIVSPLNRSNESPAKAPSAGSERTMVDAWRAAGVGVCLIILKREPAPLVAHDQVPREKVNLLPIVMNKWLSRAGVSVESEKSRPISLFAQNRRSRCEDLNRSRYARRGAGTV